MAIVGDGGFSMLMAEFATAVKCNLPIKIIVIKNNARGQIKWEQMVFLGNPDTYVSFIRSTSSRSRRLAAGRAAKC